MNNNNIINIHRNEGFKITKLTEIKEVINKLFWEVSNFLLQFKFYSGLNLSKSQDDIFLDYKNNIIYLAKKGNSLIIDFFDFIFDFDPPEDEFDNYLSIDLSNISFNNSYIYSVGYQSFFNLSFKSNIESHHEKLSPKPISKNEIDIQCFKCKKNISIYLCQTCNMVVCEQCLKELHQNSTNKHTVINFLENKDKEITLFLNSISAIFKNILIKCNCLLENKIQLKITKDIDTGEINSIKKTIYFPYFDKRICLSDEIFFLESIEKEVDDLYYNNVDKFQNSFHFSKLEKNLIDTVKIIFFEDSNISKENNNNFQIDLNDSIDEEDISIQEE